MGQDIDIEPYKIENIEFDNRCIRDDLDKKYQRGYTKKGCEKGPERVGKVVVEIFRE
ncbi:hypothetical protein NitYY0918_C0806 [Nitratiruptor sp. YY09-18]|nr:hypothetical protein NitYY0918_C0806 [Nitratiruptor sp. YY09-18]